MFPILAGFFWAMLELRADGHCRQACLVWFRVTAVAVEPPQLVAWIDPRLAWHKPTPSFEVIQWH